MKKKIVVLITCFSFNQNKENLGLTDLALNNVEALASEGSGSDCNTYCPNPGNGCILVYTNGAMVTCPNRWK